MKLLVAILIMTTAHNSFASHNRFWIGFKKKDVSTSVFMNGLNNLFFKETINVGKGKGLNSYQPYISKMTGNIPDEVALVVYESEEKYKAIRSTPEGQKYGALHWDFFEKEISKSTVSEPFTGKLTEGQAFELHPNFLDWQSGLTHVAFYERTPKTNLNQLAKAFSGLKFQKEVKNSILLITKEWIIEYRSLKNLKTKFSPLPIKVIEENRLLSSSLETLKGPIESGNGVNFLF